MDFNTILSNAKLTENGDLAFKSPVIGDTEDDIMLDILFKTEYYSNHLDEVPVKNLTWIKDYEPESAITEEDIISISNEYEDNEDKD